MVHGRRRDFGLGSASLVQWAEAREISRSYRKIARQGGDPLAARGIPEIRFRKVAETVYELNRPSWRNAKHAQGWISSIEQYADPVLGDRVLETIGTADVLSVLSPIWTTKHETARRVKQRLSTIFDWAKGNGFYSKENPVNGVTKSLPKVKLVAKHMPALPWQELPVFMADLDHRDGISARTLEFLILTGLRSNEVRGAR